MLVSSCKNYVLLIIFFGILAIALLAPLASNAYLTNSRELFNHVVGISQAKAALLEGQFPLRVMPEIFNNMRYPYFQFYSPLAYAFAGCIHLVLTPNNPLLACKITLWLGLVLAGVYMFRLIRMKFLSDHIALLAATLYLVSPYLLLNLNVRVDLTESLAICLLPMILFYSLNLHENPSWFAFSKTALVWFVLITTHIITFLSASVFIGLYLIIINIQDKLPLHHLIIVGAAYIFSCLLAAWFLYPMLTLESLMYVHISLFDPYSKNALNPLATLLSIKALAPMPLPQRGLFNVPMYVGVGLPILLSVGFLIARRLIAPIKNSKMHVTPLLFLFVISIFVAWSPIDFWQYLPPQFSVLQFSFRILSQTMWLGVLLFAELQNSLFADKLNQQYLAIGLLLILMANSSWLMDNKSITTPLAQTIKQPKLIEWGANAYVINPDVYQANAMQNVNLNTNQTQKFCRQQHGLITCALPPAETNTQVQLPILFYPGMLMVKIDGHTVPYYPVSTPKNTALQIPFTTYLATITQPAGVHIITAKFIGNVNANRVSAVCWIILLIGLSRLFWIRLVRRRI
jgi:hypothetical protein